MSTISIAGDFAPADGRVYAGRTRTQLRGALLSILFGLAGLIKLKVFLAWYHGGPVPDPRAFLVLACLLMVPIGLLCIANAMLGLPRLTVGRHGVSLRTALGTKWADWDSVSPFVIKVTAAGRSRRKIKAATAKITGTNTSLRWFKQFSIADHFTDSIEDIAADINRARAAAVGTVHGSEAEALYAEPLPVGRTGFFIPWLTFAILGVLIFVFWLESRFPVTPAVKHSPSLQTLIAMGGLDHTAILAHGEYYRLFMAPLLHGNLAHLSGNGVALLLGGWMLERLVGRLWFLVFFAVGALGGSLASLALEPANLISVGASGALMGLFAALLVSSFRISSALPSRVRLQISSLRILIPSLWPSFSHSTGVHIDYGAHFGGAMAGAVLALILRRAWPQDAAIPQARREGLCIAVVSVALFAMSANIASRKYPDFASLLSSPAKVPAPVNAPTYRRPS